MFWHHKFYATIMVESSLWHRCNIHNISNITMTLWVNWRCVFFSWQDVDPGSSVIFFLFGYSEVIGENAGEAYYFFTTTLSVNSASD